MYFVVFWDDEWSATIPSCWLFLESKTFKWPPKSKNPTLEAVKATLPEENWNTIHYSGLIGPFATCKEARDNEIQAFDISTNDEDAFQAIANKVTDEEHKEPYVKNERLPKHQITSVPRDEDEESDEDAEKILKPHNIQKSSQKPPTHYIPKSKNEESTSEVAACVSKSFNDKNSARLQNNVERQNERRTHEHHELCCAPCRTDIQAIEEAMNSIYLLVLDMSEGPRDDTKNFALNLPITTENELEDVEILLKEDAVARSQYKKMIKNIDGTTFKEHVRNALTATLTNQMACKMLWTGRNNSIMVKKMKLIDLIIETIKSRTDSTIDEIQAEIKLWFQRAGDRLPKEERIKKK